MATMKIILIVDTKEISPYKPLTDEIIRILKERKWKAIYLKK
ncbi:MAG: hypothetical protein QXD79_08280 [Candidatus Methanomethylicia archaeon]